MLIMIVVIDVDIVDLEDGMEEEEVVVEGGGGERGRRWGSRNRQYYHWYEVGRGIPYLIFVSNLTLLL